jgi:hypothetical protein
MLTTIEQKSSRYHCASLFPTKGSILLIRPKNTFLVFRAAAKVGTRPTLANVASGRAGASVPRINPATKGRVNKAELATRRDG